MVALWFQPEAPASTLWLSTITGKTIRRISEGFVIKGDRQHKACDNKMLGLGTKKLDSRDKEGSPGQAGGRTKTHSRNQNGDSLLGFGTGTVNALGRTHLLLSGVRP